MAANQGSTSKRNTPDVALTADKIYVRADLRPALVYRFEKESVGLEHSKDF
jgi:hypothetical protein